MSVHNWFVIGILTEITASVAYDELFLRCSLIARGTEQCRSAPRIKVNMMPWTKSSVLVVFSDGISGRWGLRKSPALLEKNAINP